MNLGRIYVIATNVFREVIRDRILYLVGVFALVLFAAVSLLPEVAASAEDKIILDVGIAAIGITGLITAIFIGTGLVNKEIEKRTVYVLVSKPISSPEFIVGKHLGLSSVLAVLIVAMTLIYSVTLTLNNVAIPISSIALAAVFLFIELSLITAVAILFGVFISSILATLLTFAVYLVGHLSQDLVNLAQLSENPGLQQVVENLYLVLPDLSRLDYKNQAVYGLQALPSASELLSNAAYGVVYTVLLLMISTLIFSRREF
jgi:ABC-type transport system involved in multi-copper enzyme maturation permease subunit